jgi:isocitrate/isopropylmalate dehydrogenase
MQNETRKEIPASRIPGDGIGPDIAGKGLVNPLSILLAVAMMLDDIGRQDLSARLCGARWHALAGRGARARPRWQRRHGRVRKRDGALHPGGPVVVR